MQALNALARRAPAMVRHSAPLSRRAFSAAADALTDEERELLETPREGMEYDVGVGVGWLGSGGVGLDGRGEWGVGVVAWREK